MEIKNKLSDYIISIENFLPSTKNKKIQEILDKNFFIFQKAGLSSDTEKENYYDKKIRQTETFPLENINRSMTVTYWANFLSTKFLEAGKEYCEMTNTSFVAKLTDMQILKYFKNGFYKKHTDSGINIPRTLSFIYFINDNYDGGDLVFELPSDEVIKLGIKENKLVIFPSNFLYPHTVLPVKEGIKYSIVSWAS
tara:strand:- start:3978 stop:4562 length:585 start_codon:yes stop_codon:yes gene_type:complete